MSELKVQNAELRSSIEAHKSKPAETVTVTKDNSEEVEQLIAKIEEREQRIVEI